MTNNKDFDLPPSTMKLCMVAAAVTVTDLIIHHNHLASGKIQGSTPTTSHPPTSSSSSSNAILYE